LFYMENNSVTPEERPGRGSPTSSHAAKALSEVPRAFGIDTTVLDGTRVDGVAEAIGALVARMRRGEGPFFVESRTTRWPGNYGSFPRLPGGDTDIDWAWDRERPVEEVRSWHAESDPILLWTRECERSGALSRDAIRAIDREVREEIEKAAAAALASPPPDPASALEHTYA
ncbi:MAG: hypothetical protein KGQ88_08230, partial [Chloroflexi bacterium]|nr:hypothetical protein [Chloroflexota bacterium]